MRKKTNQKNDAVLQCNTFENASLRTSKSNTEKKYWFAWSWTPSFDQLEDCNLFGMRTNELQKLQHFIKKNPKIINWRLSNVSEHYNTFNLENALSLIMNS